MRRPLRLLVPVAALTLATGCTSFADRPAPADATASPSPTPSSTAPPSATGDLAVVDEVELPAAADQVGALRVVADDGGSAVLVVGSPSSQVVSGTTATGITDAVPTDLVLVGGEPVVVGLGADPVAPDPVVGLVRAAGSTAGPAPLTPQTTAPRGLPVLAAAGDDVLYLLAEDPDAVGARVLAVDPVTAEVLDSVDLDLGVDGATAVELVGLVVTGDDQVVAGLDVRTADEEQATRLVTVDAELDPVGPATGPEGRLVGLTVAGDGEARGLVAVPDGSLRLFGPQGAVEVGRAESGTRVGGVAAAVSPAGLTVVTAVLDQSAPTVVVTGPDGPPTPLELCAGSGDALAVAAGGDGGFVVAGTCDGAVRLWTLG